MDSSKNWWVQELCPNGVHVFVWVSGSCDTEPPEGLRCECGEVEWQAG